MKKEFKPTRYGQWKMEHRIASYYITSTFFWIVHVFRATAGELPVPPCGVQALSFHLYLPVPVGWLRFRLLHAELV